MGHKSLISIEQMIELTSEKAWSRESNIEIFIATEVENHLHGEILKGLLELRTEQFDQSVVKILPDGK